MPQKPITPKKETTRITVPPGPKLMPKATVKLNQTVPMSQPKPAPALHTADLTTAVETSTAEEDPMTFYLSFAVLAAALFTLVMAIMAG